jgi:Fe-S cluster biogenesis protein NfuA
MFIQTETTPNPESLKFVPGVDVMGSAAPCQFSSVRQAIRSPLAQALFTIPQVQTVFLGSDFITVTKAADAEWLLLKPEILIAIMDHFVAGKPVTIEVDAPLDEPQVEDNEIVTQIKELIESHVRPAVAQDGGDIEFHSFEDGIVYLKMHGACSGCPSSTVTLKNGIETMLKHYVPEIMAVEAVEEA